MVHATITGYDMTMCACCGGYVLKMDNGDNSFRFNNFPANSLVDSTHFPQSVYVSYIQTNYCNPLHIIKITAMVQ